MKQSRMSGAHADLNVAITINENGKKRQIISRGRRRNRNPSLRRDAERNTEPPNWSVFEEKNTRKNDMTALQNHRLKFSGQLNG